MSLFENLVSPRTPWPPGPDPRDPWFGIQAPHYPPEPTNWMHALNLLGATLKDYSSHGRTSNVALTQDAIRKGNRADTGPMSPNLPTDAPDTQLPPSPPEPSNWMHGLNLLGATLKDYSNHGSTNNVALTQDAIRAHRAAQDRIAPYLPPPVAQAIWTARLSGHYDPAAGKYAIPALGLFPRDEQHGLSDRQMPSPYGQIEYTEDDLSNELAGQPIWDAAPDAGQAGNTRLAQNFINNNSISDQERQRKISEYAESARRFGKKTADVGTLLTLGGGIVGGATAQPQVVHGAQLLGGVLENFGGLLQNPWLDRQYGRGRTSQFEYDRSRAIDEYNRGMFFGTGGARAP